MANTFVSDAEVIIVSGLPRSGTSLMMQMLHSAGVPILCDGLRAADESNPKGYFEYEPVKSLPRENRWMEEARGQAVKIILQLLPFVPEGLPIQVLLLDRNITQVVESQRVMLERMGMKSFDAAALTATFAKQRDTAIRFLQQRPQTRFLEIPQHQLVAKDWETVQKIAHFVGIAGRENQMLDAIDPSLNRIKTRD